MQAGASSTLNWMQTPYWMQIPQMGRPNIWRRAIRVLWILTILAVVSGSLLPAADAKILGLLGDKAEHFLAYFVLALLPSLHERPRFLAGAAASAVALGILLECGQKLSPGRAFEIGDMVANTTGACVGAGTGLLLRARTAIGPFFSARQA
jgi:VanZ family protein